jgi:pimeloyl-ACP methyl ester carboxylesterase
MKQSMAVYVMRWWMLVTLAVAGPASAAAAQEQPFKLETPTGTVAGTLALPSAAGKAPVVLIIAGSGPTDRDGNSAGLPGRNDSLKMLAAALADAGFASVRYDKRGIAASRAAGPAESALRFDTYVDDAVAWVARLKADPRFTSVTVLGHSEGALTGMLAARRGGAAACVSVAGVAQRPGAILRRQLAGKLPPPLVEVNDNILAALERGQTVAEVPPALAALYRPGVQPYLISWMKYDPAREIAALRIPVLIAQGTTDIQVGVDQAELLKAAKPDATLAIVPGMNHVLKEVAANAPDPLASYSDPALPLAPQLVGAIVGFLRGLPANQR